MSKIDKSLNRGLWILLLIVDPRSITFRSQATKPCKLNGNKQTIQAYLDMNWSKLTVKEESSKHYQHNNIYGNSLYYCNNGKYIEKDCYNLSLNVSTFHPTIQAKPPNNDSLHPKGWVGIT